MAVLRDVLQFLEEAMKPVPGAEKKPDVPGKAPTIPEMLRDAVREIGDDDSTKSKCLTLIADRWTEEEEKARGPSHTIQIRREVFILACHRRNREVKWDSVRRKIIPMINGEFGKWDIPLSISWAQDSVTISNSDPMPQVSKPRTKKVRRADRKSPGAGLGR
jgi:hypothetical protein